MKLQRLRRRLNRQGAAAVEFALIFPLFVVLAISTIELGNMSSAQNVLINSSREAARIGISPNATEQQVRDYVRTSISDVMNIPSSAVSVSVSCRNANGGNTQGRGFSCAERGDLITVRVSVPYRYLGLFFGKFTNVTVTSVCTMEKE